MRWRTCRFAFLTLVTSLLLAAGCQSETQSANHLTDHRGRPLNTQNQWLLVNYWATWCKPCREEIPELNALHQQFADERLPVKIVGYNFDQLDGEALDKAAAELDIRFPLLSSPSLMQLDLPGAAGIPVTFLLDPQGNYSDRLLGEQTRASVLAVLQKHGAITATTGQ